MTTVDVHATCCAVCSTEGNSTELYSANFSPEDFSPAVFSARRLPDRIHYRLVRCNSCGLVRSDPVADSSIVANLYRESTFDYSGEVDNLAHTYGTYLARLDSYGVHKDALLEIGCGNGFFLAEASRRGYRDVRGVEPSESAIQLAEGEVRPQIVCAMMTSGLFPRESFDVVCLFQVLDHILDPGSLLETCFQILKPGGFVLCLNHNVEALSARLMKDRSPIVDIEHTYLYSPVTLARLFAKLGFQVKESAGVRNRYSLNYLLRLVPSPAAMKSMVLRIASSTGLARMSFSVPLGNLYIVAQKPLAGARG
jgi:SAM-dependent methyltransferase